MGEQETLCEAIADSTRDLLRQLAAVSAEGEALRREMEMAWGLEEDERPTSIPISISSFGPDALLDLDDPFVALDQRDAREERDTLPA